MQKHFNIQYRYAISSWLNMNSGLTLGSVSQWRGNLFPPTHQLSSISINYRWCLRENEGQCAQETETSFWKKVTKTPPLIDFWDLKLCLINWGGLDWWQMEDFTERECTKEIEKFGQITFTRFRQVNLFWA